MKQDPCVYNIDSIENIQDFLYCAVAQLDLLEHSLLAFLEQKRQVFPRFYFLSDEDLIRLLGDSYQPRKIS